MDAQRIVGKTRVTRQKNAGGKSSPSTSKIQNYKTGARVAPRAANDNNVSYEQPANDNAVRQRSSVKKPIRPGAAQLASTLGGENTAQLLQRARAIRTGWIVISTSLVFWPIQVFFWALAIGFFGLAITPGVNILEHIPFLNAATSWSRWFSLSQLLLIGVIGIPMMIYAAFMFIASRVPCFNTTSKVLIFIFCVTGYCVVFLNIIPWVAVWALSVMFLPEKNNPPEEQ